MAYNPNHLLLDYQKRWIADTSPLKLGEKSRRTGLTWAEAADATLTASAAKPAGGKDHFYIGSGKDMAVEFIDAAAMWARAYDKAGSDIAEEVIDDEGKDILSYVIRFASGFKIQALSSNPSNMRGRQGNVTIDEAAFQDRFSEVLKAATAMLMWGANVRVISTHNGVENPFNELLQDSRAGKKDYSLHRITIEDAIADGLYKRICQVTGKVWTPEAEADWLDQLMRATATREDALEEYYCVPKQGGGAYLSRALIEARMVDAPVLRFEGTAEFNSWAEPLREAEIRDWCNANLAPLLDKLDQAECHVLGEDFGRSGDLTVLAPMAVSQQLKRRVPFLVELRNVPFKQQEQILYYIADRLPKFSGAALDARGNGQYLAEQAGYRYGDQVQQVMLSNAWYLENMPKFKAALEDDELAIPRDADVLDDLRALQVIKGVPKLPDGKTGDNKQRHGDAAIALVLAYAASLAEVRIYAYEPVGQSDDEPNRRGTW